MAIWAKIKVFYANLLANLVATTTAAGFDVANLLDWREGSFWKAANSATQYITNTLLVSSFATSVFDASATAPQGISYASDGTLWICDGATDRIYNVQTDGTLISSFSTAFFDASATAPRGVSYASNGTLWICDLDTDKIYNVKTTGLLISSFSTSVFDASATAPTGISYAPNGTLWICDEATDKIYNIQTDGTLISSFSTSIFDASAIAPAGISYAPNGTLWICDGVTDKIYNIQTDGTLISSFPTSVFDVSATAPTGISYAPNGTLWICDSPTDNIYNIPLTFNSDYLFVSGHNLNSIGALATLQYSSDNFSADINDAMTYSPINDKTFAVEFTTASARYWRLKLSGMSAAPQIAICVWGEKIELDYASSSFDPYAERVTADIKKTLGGVIAGIHEKFSEREMSLRFDDADSTLYYKIKALWDTQGLMNFGVAWETANNPEDVYLMRQPKRFKNPLVRGGIYRKITLNLTGRKE